MGCGCGKGRQATSAAKDRMRSGGGQTNTLNQYISGQTSSPTHSQRVSQYNQTLRDYMRGK